MAEIARQLEDKSITLLEKKSTLTTLLSAPDELRHNVQGAVL